MTRLFTTGAEEYDILALWDAVDDVSINQFDPRITFGYGTNMSFAPRTGRGMYLLDQNSYLRKDFGAVTSYTELYFGFAAKLPVLNSIHFFYASTDSPGVYSNYLGLRVTSSGVLEVSRSNTTIASSAAGVIVVNTWHYYEVWFKPLNSNGRAVVYVDGVKVIDLTGDTTNDLELINAYWFTGVQANSGIMQVAFDDIVVNSAGGTDNNTYPGMVRLLPIRANDTGTNADWTRAGVDLGSDEAQTRNGTFEFSMLQSTSADDKVSLTSEVPDLPAGATIANIVLSCRARVQAGAGVVAPMVVSNSTEDISADQTLVSAWRYYQYAWSVNPDDSAVWEEADLALLEIGVSS